jgi:hypothetical protein
MSDSISPCLQSSSSVVSQPSRQIKLSSLCLETIKQIVSKNPDLKRPILDFLNFGCVIKIIGAGANGVVFLTFQNQIVKVCFSPYDDIYQNKDGDLRCTTLDIIISLRVTALCDYEITGRTYMELRQYMSLQSFTLNEILTSSSTSAFTICCMNQLLALVFKLWKCGFIHNDVKPINIMLSSKQSRKRKRDENDENDELEQEYDMVFVDVESIFRNNLFRASRATPPYSMSTVGPTANALYMVFVTMISSLCLKSNYPKYFHEGGIYIIPNLVTNLCRNNYSLDIIKQFIKKLLGYEQSTIVVNMLVSLIYAVALNSCEVHPQKMEYTEFITTHFSQLRPFIN